MQRLLQKTLKCYAISTVWRDLIVLVLENVLCWLRFFKLVPAHIHRDASLITKRCNNTCWNCQCICNDCGYCSESGGMSLKDLVSYEKKFCFFSIHVCTAGCWYKADKNHTSQPTRLAWWTVFLTALVNLDPMKVHCQKSSFLKFVADDLY